MSAKKINLKKVLLTIFCLFSFSLAFSNEKQSSQLVQSGHWIYNDLALLATENKEVMFLETQPLSIGEIRFYLNNVNYDKLSDSGKIVYNRILDYINHEDDFVKNHSLRLFLNLQTNPELFFKSNKNIDWTFSPNFKDTPIKFPVIIGFSDLFTIQSDFIFSMTPEAASKPNNFMNLSLDLGSYDMYITRFAYLSSSKVFSDWGISAHMGKEGMKIGHTALGSIIYNDTFVSDFYCQLNLFTNFLKFTMDVTQVEQEKYLYLHQLTLRPFKNFSIGVVEGSLINAPFELRYLNPLMIMHQMEAWKDYNPGSNSESNFCAYLCFTIEYIPIKNMRIYALYAQNEIDDFGNMVAGELPDYLKAWPNSLGGQLGIEYFIPLQNKTYLKTIVETQYTSPYLYVKHSPRWSLIRTKRSGNDSAMKSWLGSPLGPDSFVVLAGVEYETNKKWSIGLDYKYSIHGINTADNLFSQKIDDKFNYYPSDRYHNFNDNGDTEGAQIAVKDARNMWMHGTPEYKNQFIIKGHYKVLDNLDLSGQFTYSFIFNNKNQVNNFQQGVELAIAATYNLF